MTIELTINGRRVAVDGETALVDYLASIGTEARAVAVEINGRILDRAEFPTTRLRAGDQIEIVRMVGGGRPQP
jgi:sulfur carrier protein